MLRETPTGAPRAHEGDIAAPSGATRTTSATAASSYERRFAEMLGEGVSARAFWKGRVAFYALLQALGVGPGDDVILPGFTCVVVPNAVRLAGATPIFADIEPGGYNIDPAKAARLVSARTRVLLIQHSFGIPARMDELLELAKQHRLLVVEDCAHTVGSQHDGRPLGTMGDGAFFSFQWSKPYTTGLGGMAVTSDPHVAERLRRVHERTLLPPLGARLRINAQYQVYRRLFSPRMAWRAQELLHAVSRVGLFIGSSSEAELEGGMPTDHAWRMGPSQEARGERLLGTVSARNAHADAISARYDGRLRAAGWPITRRPPGASLLRYPVAVGDKDRLLIIARGEQIELGSWFETPLHPVPLGQHARFGYVVGQCPNAEHAARNVVNLPVHPRVSAVEADRIAGFLLGNATRPPG